MHEKLVTDIIGWDVKNWSRAVAFWDSRVRWDAVQDCLELGAGAGGGLSLWLALKGKTVTCSELPTTVNTWEALHANYDLPGTIAYADVDATCMPFREQFDLVVLKSVLGGIRPRGKDAEQGVVDGIFRALRPGGVFLFAENLVGSPAHQFFRKACTTHMRHWRYFTPAEIRELVSAFSAQEITTVGISGVFGRIPILQNALGTLDEHVLERVCPEAWRYIAFGIAVK